MRFLCDDTGFEIIKIGFRSGAFIFVRSIKYVLEGKGENWPRILSVFIVILALAVSPGELKADTKSRVVLRVGDAAPLHPLKGAEAFYVDREVTEDQLEETENAAFRLKEAEMEEHGSTVKPWAEKAMSWTLIGELLIVAVLAVMRGLPNAIEQFGKVTQ
ncbi:MAG: hypothetical protein IH856_24560 [Deltaproteobacteria bacterium]|nr:hypothetical protein [Deltaproteobacteria bacterium]